MATREESVTNTSLIASHPHLEPPPSPPLPSTPFPSSSFLHLLFNPQHYSHPSNPISSILPLIFFSRRPPQTRTRPDQGVTKRCRLCWRTNYALLYEPKCRGMGGGVGSQPMSKAVYITWHGAQITPYLTYEPDPLHLAFWEKMDRIWYATSGLRSWIESGYTLAGNLLLYLPACPRGWGLGEGVQAGCGGKAGKRVVFPVRVYQLESSMFVLLPRTSTAPQFFQRVFLQVQ